MKRSLLKSFFTLVPGVVALVGGNIFAATGDSSPRMDMLEFSDGSVLHGSLKSIDAEKGLVWEYPNAKAPLEFKPQNLAWLRFSQVKPGVIQSEATCQFHFANGDEFFGKLLSLDANEMELQTWFGGKFKTPRDSVSALRFFPKGTTAFYQGPTGLEGWHMGKDLKNPPWHYQDGALVSRVPGTLGRDLHLPDASRVEFNLEWNAPFSLLFSYYTGGFDGLDFNSSCYMFYINPGSVSLQRLDAGVSSMSMGRSEIIPALLGKKKVRMEFRADKNAKTLELLVDGKFVNQWTDPAGWVAKGTGILFFLQTDGAEIKISNLIVSEWDGRAINENPTNAASVDDQIQLVNQDKVSGKVASVTDGKVKIIGTPVPLEVPVARVTQIRFGGAPTNTPASAPWEVQASFSGGGIISFALDQWNDGKVLGQNKNFGKIALDTQSIRQIQFNVAKTKATAAQAAQKEDEFWGDDGK